VDVLYWCENLAAIATANATAIVPMGINAAKLTAFGAAIGKYKLSLQTPADQRGESQAAGIAVDAKIVEIDASLEILDALMDTQRIDQALLYNKYQADRAIDDNASGTTSPDVSMTLLPGFNTVYNVPYNSGRLFRLRNNSPEAINYSLSSNDKSFDEPATALKPTSETQKLSSNIASRGDKFIIENPSTNAVSIDLWIIE
jgi:hypothetical protein